MLKVEINKDGQHFFPFYICEASESKAATSKSSDNNGFYKLKPTE